MCYAFVNPALVNLRKVIPIHLIYIRNEVGERNRWTRDWYRSKLVNRTKTEKNKTESEI